MKLCIDRPRNRLERSNVLLSLLWYVHRSHFVICSWVSFHMFILLLSYIHSSLYMSIDWCRWYAYTKGEKIDEGDGGACTRADIQTHSHTHTHTHTINGSSRMTSFCTPVFFLGSFGQEWTWTMFLSANSATLIAGRPRCVRQKSLIFRQKSRTFLDKGPTFLQKSSVCWPRAFQSHTYTQSHTGHDNNRFQWASQLVWKLNRMLGIPSMFQLRSCV